MASKDTQRKLLLTVAFAGAVTAWIALRISKDDDKHPDKYPDAGSSRYVDASLFAESDAADVMRDASSDATNADAAAEADALTGSLGSDATTSAADAATGASDATVSQSDAAAASAPDASALTDAAVTVRPEPTGEALLAQTELTADARKPLLSLLASTDAGGAVQKLMGKITVPGGRLGLYGCTVHPYSEDREVLIPAGVYPLVHAASTLGEGLILKVSEAPWTALKQVATLDIGGDRLCLMPKEAATELEAKGSLEGLLELLRTDGGSGPSMVSVPKTKLTFSVMETARDKGPVYLAYDSKGRTAAVLLGVQSK
jgi:hypothetical protein